MPISPADRDLAKLAASAAGDGLLSGLAHLAPSGASYMLGLLVNGMTIYGRTVPTKDFGAAIDAQNETWIARGRTASEAEGWDTAADTILGIYASKADEDEERRRDLIERSAGVEYDELPEEDLRLDLKLRLTHITLAEVNVFPAGGAHFTLPLIRISIAQVAGWWLVPVDEDGNGTITHPAS
jgi:hypothetical protein